MYTLTTIYIFITSQTSNHQRQEVRPRPNVKIKRAPVKLLCGAGQIFIITGEIRSNQAKMRNFYNLFTNSSTNLHYSAAGLFLLRCKHNKKKFKNNTKLNSPALLLRQRACPLQKALISKIKAGRENKKKKRKKDTAVGTRRCPLLKKKARQCNRIAQESH